MIFPGSNCDRDLVHVLGTVLRQEVVLLWHGDGDLRGLGCGDWILLPGGFSFGDYLRPGAIARFSPIMESLRRFVDEGGYVLGICNGFQILCESGFLPGALLRNVSTTFVCQRQYVLPVGDTVLTRYLSRRPLDLPIAHSDGRYYVSEDVLRQLEKNNQIVFQYCTEDGRVVGEANPNGSVENIAGICDVRHRVFGMMPHPERNADPLVCPRPDGLLVFQSILRSVETDLGVISVSD